MAADSDAMKSLELLVANVGRVANAITPLDAADGRDATGVRVSSMTEALMGVTAAMVQIANAIDRLAEAAEDANQGRSSDCC